MAVLLILASLGFCWAVYKTLTTGRRESNLPPGPPTLPLLGNIHQLPSVFIHYQFTKWAKEFGDVYSVKIAGGTMVILSSTAAVREIMDKRGATTGDRPKMYMTELAGEGLNIAFMSSESDIWKKQRKAMRSFLTPQSLEKNLPTQKAESIQLLHDVLTSPEKLYQHVQRVSFSSQLSLVYGKRNPTFEPGTEVIDFYRILRLWDSVNDQTAHPPVDLLPVFKLIPTWTGMAKWRQLCEKVKAERHALYLDRMLAEAEKRWEQNPESEDTCYMQGFMKNMESLGMDRKQLGHMGAALMEAGSDTTTSFMLNFVATVLSFPECQKKAQEEIDRVVGNERMPTLEDFNDGQLPYLSAFIKEVHRFRPVFPLGVPHANIQDEVYNGYLIPKGSMLFVNSWGMLHDPDVFEDPDSFIPERFLKHENGTKDGQDFRTGLVFGVGRRQCPGEPMAHRTINMNALNLLWAFELTSTEGSVNKKGTLPVDLENYCTPGLELSPKAFTCKVVPRNAERAEVIRAAFAHAF